MKKVKIAIVLEGELPEKYMNQKKKIQQRILDDALDEFGEYEILGEFFGDDENIYAFFLTEVNMEEK